MGVFSSADTAGQGQTGTIDGLFAGVIEDANCREVRSCYERRDDTQYCQRDQSVLTSKKRNHDNKNMYRSFVILNLERGVRDYGCDLCV